MAKKREILYVFDLHNTHDEYAKCLEFITILQGNSTISIKQKKFERIRQLVEEINVSGMWVPNCAKNYYEEPLESSGFVEQPSITLAKKLSSESVQLSILDETPNSMHFHIRVHFRKTKKLQVGDLTNLHYLALLLQRLDHVMPSVKINGIEKNGIKKRVSVFIVPFTDRYYPFSDRDNIVDFDTYKTVSTYLRLLSKRYTGIIYGVVQRNNSIAVRALDFRRTARLIDAFPLIPLDRRTYPQLFEGRVTSETVNNLFSLKSNGRVLGANDIDPYKAFSAYIAETAYYHFKNTFTKYAYKDNVVLLGKIRDEVTRLICEEHICLLSFAIFLFTFCTIEQNITGVQKAIQENMEFAEELCSGLRQLSQNTLQHSSCREGVLSLYLEQDEEDKKLRVMLSDYNDQQTFIDNFVCNLKREVEYTDNFELKQKYMDLVQHREIVTMGHFFGEYGNSNPSNYWINFREVDSAAHIGLLLFSLTMKRCEGTVKIINSTEYSVQRQNCFYCCYSADNEQQNDINLDLNTRVIPGAHLAFTVPVRPIEEQRPTGLGQLVSKQPIYETYESFATYLDYHPVEEKFFDEEFRHLLDYEKENHTEMFVDTPTASAVTKYKTIYCWERYWDKYGFIVEDGEEQLFYFDVSKLPEYYVDSADNIEMFIKGFINSLDRHCKYSKEILFAFTNVSRLFMNTFRQITISLATKKFPTNLQLYVIESNLTESIHLLGDDFCQAISNAYTLSLEHGSRAYSFKEVNRAHYLKFQNSYSQEIRNQGAEAPLRLVCPFDVILLEAAEKPFSIFDRKVQRLAEYSLDMPNSGYKLDNIHMRLGSKIHIRAFYEMAFLFYRTSISNRIAFEILRNLRDGVFSSTDKVDIFTDDIIFYGYASYSKALLTSILEILKSYRAHILDKMAAKKEDPKEKLAIVEAKKQIPEHLAFVSYQHNLQSDFQVEDTELYFNFYNTVLGECADKHQVRFNRNVKIVQIVPISSTLTTFDKMESRIKEVMKDSVFKTVARYTVFWVTDALAESESIPREDTEKKYWDEVDIENRKIYRKENSDCENAPSINYFMRSLVVWENPLNCELCYPENVIAEVPLVETDRTSTVPTQQLRGLITSNNRAKENDEENDERLLELKSCITYGHIRRETNHFQFYIETQNYFNRVNAKVKKWLEKLREIDNKQNEYAPSILNIIFSPEHATNVGFAQYVNNYYFGGNAEIVCVNEGKEYRSNFKCEHMALTKTMEDLFASAPSNKALPVRFYFVDDTIITGETFHKAVSLLHSLIPSKYRSRFSTNLIQKCFLLVDRLSRESKSVYVKDVDKDFLSFVHIDISNMRTQGDSCVGCKLEINAKKLLKRSATRNIANYWADKAQRYKVRGYSCVSIPTSSARDKAFRKLVLSHITQNVLFNDNEYFDLGAIYDSILTVFAMILGEKPKLAVKFKYNKLIDELNREEALELLKDFLKIVSRPFFSFDFKVKLQVLTLLLLFAEFLVNDGSLSLQSINDDVALRGSRYKAFLFEGDRVTETFRLLEAVKTNYLKTKEQQINFFVDCILDCLVELRSTYLMRKVTISKFLRFLMVNKNNKAQEHELSGEFWKEYVAGIHQILDCNSDETKALWLEYLLISGDEYSVFQQKRASDIDSYVFKPQMLFDVLTADYSIGRDSAFFHFCNELFLQNNRVLFDGIEGALSKQSSVYDCGMEYWKTARAINRFISNCNYDDKPSEAEQELFVTLEKAGESDGQYKVTERYKGLLDKILAMARVKYGFEQIDIALITCMDEARGQNDNYPEISQLDLVSCSLNSTSDLHFNKYDIKKKLVDALSNAKGLRTYGYHIARDQGNQRAYFFIYFDSINSPIVPVYMYFSSLVEAEQGDFKLMLLLRDVLSYRNRLLKMLKSDFAGDIFPKYAHTSGEKNILAHEKATSHNTTGDDIVTLEIFMDPKSANKYSVLDSNQALKWLLLHNYTNAQIAKLFNRSYRTEEYDNCSNVLNPPPLYLQDVDTEQMMKRSWFERPLRKFSDLRLAEDGRIALISTVVNFDFHRIANIFEVEFLKNQKGECYNVEYFKNVLIDIIISAMKYSTASATYLERVDKYMVGVNKLKHCELLTDEMKELLFKGQCCVEFDIKTIDPQEGFNYMVISNNVNKLAHNLFDWEKHNESIKARLDNPIDCADGHMSLLAISQYIEGLWPERLHKKSIFKYVVDDGQLKFETWLPIIRKE